MDGEGKHGGTIARLESWIAVSIMSTVSGQENIPFFLCSFWLQYSLFFFIFFFAFFFSERKSKYMMTAVILNPA